MSMDRCSRCGRAVDTDDDTDCYFPDPRHSLRPHPDICVCEVCRDEHDFYADRELDKARSTIADYEELINGRT